MKTTVKYKKCTGKIVPPCTGENMLESLKGRKITQRSFVNSKVCSRIAKNFREWAELGGFDGYEDTSLSADQCNNIADQFEIAGEKGGNYISNIITPPFFTQTEIETALTAI